MNNNITDTYKFLVGGLIRQIGAKNILEIGLGREAHTAKVCLDYITEKNEGKYVVLDFNPLLEAKEILSKYDTKFWELRVGDTTKDDYLFQNCHDNRFDLILIDGSHWITDVINDFQKLIVNGCCKTESLFIFHDTGGSHVRHAVITIAEHFKLETFEIPNANLTLAKFSNKLS